MIGYTYKTIALGALLFSGIAAATESECDDAVVKYSQLNANILGTSLPYGRPKSVETKTVVSDSGIFLSAHMTFDTCGQLEKLTERYQEVNERIKLDTRGASQLSRTSSGWEQQYDLTITKTDSDTPVVVQDAKGTTRFTLNREGWIGRSENTLATLEDPKGTVSTTQYHLNKLGKLAFTNTNAGPEKGAKRYTYNANDKLAFLITPTQQDSYIYDANNRLIRFIRFTVYPWNISTTKFICKTCRQPR